VEALLRDELQRILLVQTSGRSLASGWAFCLAILAQKVDPYLAPLYDALHEDAWL
jgi:phosphate starvation-inducible protein PhoH